MTLEAVLRESTGLLESAIAYARTTLPAAAVAPADLPTPCARWTLVELLTHMDDALEAFHEAAGGRVLPPATRPEREPAVLVQRLRVSACALLASWSASAPARVTVGGPSMPTTLLLETAALEIAVHGWDVAASTGGPPLPETLAARLLPAATDVVAHDPGAGGHESHPRFARPVPVAAGAPLDTVLLARLGRRAVPL